MRWPVVCTLLWDYIYPRLCPVCDARLAPHEWEVCAPCALALERYYPVLHCAHERLYGSPLFRQLYSLWAYRRGTGVQRLIHALKYHGHRSLAGHIVRMALLGGVRPEGRYDAIIPVPASPERRRRRGYNQSELLARALSEELGVEILTSVVERRRGSHSQTHLHKIERIFNAREAFILSDRASEALRGRTILLVDDVLTTGSTLMSLCDLLEEVGVEVVDVYVAAVAL